MRWLKDGESSDPPTCPNFNNKILDLASVGSHYKELCAGANSKRLAVSDSVQ